MEKCFLKKMIKLKIVTSIKASRTPFILYVLFCLIFIFYYFFHIQLKLRKVKYPCQGHNVAQPNFKHHVVLPYLKTKEISFFFHS